MHCTCIHHISNAHLSSYDEGRYYTHFDKIVALASFVSSPGPLMAKGLPVANFVSCVRILECVFFSIHKQFFKWFYAIIKYFLLLLGKSWSAVVGKALVWQICWVDLTRKLGTIPSIPYKCSHTNVWYPESWNLFSPFQPF